MEQINKPFFSRPTFYSRCSRKKTPRSDGHVCSVDTVAGTEEMINNEGTSVFASNVTSHRRDGHVRSLDTVAETEEMINNEGTSVFTSNVTSHCRVNKPFFSRPTFYNRCSCKKTPRSDGHVCSVDTVAETEEMINNEGTSVFASNVTTRRREKRQFFSKPSFYNRSPVKIIVKSDGYVRCVDIVEETEMVNNEGAGASVSSLISNTGNIGPDKHLIPVGVSIQKLKKEAVGPDKHLIPGTVSIQKLKKEAVGPDKHLIPVGVSIQKLKKEAVGPDKRLIPVSVPRQKLGKRAVGPAKSLIPVRVSIQKLKRKSLVRCTALPVTRIVKKKMKHN